MLEDIQNKTNLFTNTLYQLEAFKNQPAGIVTSTVLTPSTTPDPVHVVQYSWSQTFNITHASLDLEIILNVKQYIYHTLTIRPKPLQLLHVDVNGGIVT